MAFLELNKVGKSYGTNGSRTEVLKDVDLSIERGEFVAIVGYSGAGKTTLISTIAGLVKPDAGSVLLDGHPVTEPGPDRGVVFQSYSLLPWLSVFENVKLAVDQVFSDWPQDKRRAHTDAYVAKVGLSHARDRRPGQLSGGMRQRVAVARALAMSPAILLLDEPLSALDALTRANLQDELMRIWEQDRKTVVMVTNDVDEGILLADRVIPLSAGPGATLGPGARVDIPRPRKRKAINHDPRFKAIRESIIDYLLGPGGRLRAVAARTA